MPLAFEISDVDIQRVLAGDGVNVSLGKAESYRGLLDQGKIEKAALFGNDLDIQTKHARAEIRKQLAQNGLFDETIAEWVGLHYKRNFDAESQPKKREWRERWAETMEQADFEG